MGVQQKYGTINKFYKRRYLEGDWLQSFNLLHFENKTSRLDGTGGVAQSRRGASVRNKPEWQMEQMTF